MSAEAVARSRHARNGRVWRCSGTEVVCTIPHIVVYAHAMPEQHFDETYVRQELEERFRKVFGRDMNAAERRAFFLPCDSSEEAVGDTSD